ncbi:leucine-rich repeat-containing protein 24-like [Physella acuta]|uniref:leucine-rich repeat-containing protein 24-like n=1 Tax=Physella acuta TaxID=109671 RepID=UPI0027DD39B7|nr:leucine-rich repeat-containing protein 24-like [Physella acuta]
MSPPRLHANVPVYVLLLTCWALSSSLTDGNKPLCEYNPSHTVANCSGNKLETVPWTLHKNLHRLDLSSNSFTVVKNVSFIHYEYLKHLYMKNNSIVEVEARAFEKLMHLELLDLSNNKMVHIPATALETVSSSLERLYLSGNKIHSVPKGSFHKLLKLIELDLSGNSIKVIDYGALKGLVSLQIFRIRHNALETLPSDAFDDFSKNVKVLQIYENPWVCDCKMRWLRTWLNETDPTVWTSYGYQIRCERPSIVREKPLDTLPLDDLACDISMKTSAFSNENLAPGENTTLWCKYTSIPDAEAKWLKNSVVIDPNKEDQKYSISAWNQDGSFGEKTQFSELQIRNFQYSDIAKYKCFVQNIRGTASTEFKLSLSGIPYESVTTPVPGVAHASASVDIRSIVISVAVVCGIILIIVISVLIFCTVNYVQRKKQEKKNKIMENVKQHFINNSEKASNGDISGLNDTKLSSKSMEDKLNSCQEDDRSTSNNTNDSNTTTVRRPLIIQDTEPPYVFQQPGSPFNNGNTYVSFGSELTDPEEFPPPLPQYGTSHAGSATPLLDRYTPTVFDSEEMVEDYSQYPVYDSLTKSLQHPNAQQNDVIYASRIDSTSSYASIPYHNGNGDGAKSLSSFNTYSPNINGSTPRAVGSTRSIIALTPRYADYNGDGSPRQDYHRQTPNSSDYRDYRDLRYPPPHRMTHTTPKSMSVGNLGYSPMSTGPRKPPRLFQSREYMELTPQDSSADYITSPEAQQYSQSYGITPGTPV